ncbi:S1 family peptidase [Streptomyces adonidis]|uniref:S1 family peptidase n=1 Tax=Streptomyces adonidis TaxID=3231367 RepID=UPI0034DB57D3
MRNGRPLSPGATGFIVKHEGKDFLVTNWHVLAGRHQQHFQPLSRTGASPDSIEICHHTERLGETRLITEPLYEGIAPLWLEHPTLKRHVDIAILPLTQIGSGIRLFPHNAYPDVPLKTLVTDTAFVVGFPYAVRVADFTAVWTSGSIASEPGLSFQGLPVFLIDSKTRHGQSGSPFVRFIKPGTLVINHEGDLVVTDREYVDLLGIYSGRVNDDSDIGRVWKLSALQEILEGGVTGNSEYYDPGLPAHPSQPSSGLALPETTAR